jgi:hypothetical protein
MSTESQTTPTKFVMRKITVEANAECQLPEGSQILSSRWLDKARTVKEISYLEPAPGPRLLTEG